MTITTALRAWANSGIKLFTYEVTAALVVVLTIPFILHSIFFRLGSHRTRRTILLLGPSNSGKTSFLTRLDRGPKTKTHTSQTSATAELILPADKIDGSDTYRSINDPSRSDHRKFYLIDTPGHEKLRYLALQNVTNTPNLKDVIFVVDASTIKVDDDCLRKTTDYLYEVLLLLKKRAEESNYSKEIHVLIAANKMDLFTAIPAAHVQKILESEISRLRVSKQKSLLDSGIASGDEIEDPKDDWLGEKGTDTFTFSQLKAFENITIEVSGGHLLGEEPNLEKWLAWISERLESN